MKKKFWAIAAALVTAIVVSLVPVMTNASSGIETVKDTVVRDVLANSIVVHIGAPEATVNGELVELKDGYDRVTPVEKDGKLYVPGNLATVTGATTVAETTINGKKYVALDDVATALEMEIRELGNIVVLSKDASVLDKAEKKESDIELLFGLFVAPDGTGSGTFKGPLGSLQDAKGKAKATAERIGWIGDEYKVYFRGGLYPIAESVVFSTQDSAPEGCTLVFDAYPGEEPQFDGSVSIKGSQMTQVTSNAILNRVPDEAKGYIYSIDLKQFGYTPKAGNPNSQYILYDGTKFTQARWPNYSDAKTDKAVKDTYSASSPYVSTTIKDVDRALRWGTASDVWMNVSFVYTWANQDFRATVDPKTATVTCHDTKPSYQPIGNNKTYYMYNLIEELDIEGEFFIDRSTNTLYLIPYKSHLVDGTFADRTINICTLGSAMVDLQGVKGVSFRRLTFQNSTAKLVNAENASFIEFLGCDFMNTAGAGIYGRGMQDFKVNSNDFHNLGGTCVDHEGGRLHTLSDGRVEIINNRMYDVARGVGSQYYTAHGIRVAHNDITRTQEQAVSGLCSLGYYELNEVWDTGTRRVADSGTFYTYMNPYVTNRTLQHNYVHDTDGTMTIMYSDNASTGFYCYNNLYRHTSRPFYSNGGEQNWFISNMTLDQSHSEHGDEMAKVAAAERDDNTTWDFKNLKLLTSNNWSNYQITMFDRSAGLDWELYKNTPPYDYVYKLYAREYLDLPYENVIKNNASIRSGGIAVDKWTEPYLVNENNVQYTDYAEVGFVDYDSNNFNLREDSKVYKDIPEYKHIDFDNVGIYIDEYRTKLPEWDFDFNLLMPANKAEDVDANEIVFLWEANEHTRKFRFELATDPEFKYVIRDSVVMGNTITIKNLRYGENRYYWRVTAMNTDAQAYDKNAIQACSTPYFSFTTRAEEIVNIKPARDAIERANVTKATIHEGENPGEHKAGTAEMFDAEIKAFAEYVETKSYSQREIDKRIAKFTSVIDSINGRKHAETITLDRYLGNLAAWDTQPNVTFHTLDERGNGIKFERTSSSDNYSTGITTPIENYQTIQFDTEFDLSKEGSWLYYGLRASGTHGAYNNTTLYFIVVNNQGLEFQRWGAGARLYTTYFDDKFKLENNKRYSIEYGAIDDEDGNVRITFKINGETAIEYVDSTDEKIVDKGFFTVYCSTTDTPIRILEYTGQTQGFSPDYVPAAE